MAYAAGWLAAGVVAVVFGSVSVSMLSNRVTGSRPAPLNADEVRQQLIDAEATTTTTTVLDSSPTTLAQPAPPPPPPTSTTVPSPPRARPPAPATTTTVAPAHQEAPAELRSYTLVGGTVTLRFSASGVTVEVATPNPGFAVDVEPTHENGVRVELESEDHHSQVEGWWDGGPRDEVQEDSD